MASQDGSIQVVNHIEDSQIDSLVALMHETYWGKGRTHEEVAQLLKGSTVIVAMLVQSRVVAFVRVVSDCVFKALIYDVMVATDYQSQGLGRKLIDHLLTHETLSRVMHVELYCRPEMTPFYRKWGFDSPANVILLRRTQAPASPATTCSEHESPFTVVTSIDDSQIAGVHALMQSTWWGGDRTLADAARVIAGSTVVMAMMDGPRVVACVRAISDAVHKALVLDVIVSEKYRGQGLGRRLMDLVVHHPMLSRVAHLELYCLPEMTSFYAKWDFHPPADRVFIRRVQTSAHNKDVTTARSTTVDSAPVIS